MCKNTSISGLNDNCSIANTFRSRFGAVYYNSDEDTSSVNAFVTIFKNYRISNSCEDVINGLTTELIEKCVNNLRLGKACGPDELCVQHIKHAHSLVVHCIRHLSILMGRHEHVLSVFSKGIIASLVKDKSGDECSIAHHLITYLLHLYLLSPKFFLMFTLNFCADNLVSDKLKFGFKQGLVFCTRFIHVENNYRLFYW